MNSGTKPCHCSQALSAAGATWSASAPSAHKGLAAGLSALATYSALAEPTVPVVVLDRVKAKSLLNARGVMVEPQNILRAAKAVASAAALTGVAVHTLRHSAATTWLENGVHLKAVPELLGHASIAITADIYGHLSEETARGAMETLSDAIGLQRSPTCSWCSLAAPERMPFASAESRTF